MELEHHDQMLELEVLFLVSASFQGWVRIWDKRFFVE